MIKYLKLISIFIKLCYLHWWKNVNYICVKTYVLLPKMTQKQVFSVWIDREEMNWKRWVSSVTVYLSGFIKLQTSWFCREIIFLVSCKTNGRATADFNGSKTLPLGYINHSWGWVPCGEGWTEPVTHYVLLNSKVFMS